MTPFSPPAKTAASVDFEVGEVELGLDLGGVALRNPLADRCIDESWEVWISGDCEP